MKCSTNNLLQPLSQSIPQNRFSSKTKQNKNVYILSYLIYCGVKLSFTLCPTALEILFNV